MQKIDYVGTKYFYGAVIQDDVIYVSAYNHGEDFAEVIAFSIKDMKQIWRTVLDRKYSLVAPAINNDDGKLYIPCTDGFYIRGKSSSLIYSLELDNGDIDWTREVDGAVFSSLLYHQGLVFYQNYYCADTLPGSTSDGGDFGCINASNGTVKWVKRMAYSYPQGSVDSMFPGIFGNQIFVPNTYIEYHDENTTKPGRTSIFYLFNQQSGNIVKEIIQKNCLLPSLSIDQDSYNLTYTEINNQTYIQKLDNYSLDGTKKWTFLKSNSIGSCATPIFNSKYIFLKSRDGVVFCINKETGKELWQSASEFGSPSGDGSGYAVNDEYMVASFWTENSSQIMVMDLSSPDLNVVWEEKIPDLIFQVILYDEKMIFIGSKNIYVYDGEMPEIFFDPINIEAEMYEKEKTTVTIHVSNKGKGKLLGSLHSEQEWIKIPQKRFENNRLVNITLDASELTKGSYIGNIDIISNDGFYRIPVSITVLKKDLTPPLVTILFPEDNFETIEKEITIQGKVIDEESEIQKLMINDEEVRFDQDGFFEKKVLLSIGSNNIEIFAINEFEISSLKTITVIRKLPDTTGPVITISSPSSDSYTNILFIDIKGRVIDEESDITSLTINQQPVKFLENGLFESKDHQLQEGNNRFNIEAVNSANLSSSTSILVTLDTIPPNIKILYPETDLIINEEDILISCLVEDKGSQIEKVYINNQAVTINDDNMAEMLIKLKEGNNTIEVRATDKVGNANTITRSIFLDMQAPVLELMTLFDPNSLQYKDEFSIQFYVSDEGSGLMAVYITSQQGNIIQLKNTSTLFKATLPLQKGSNLFTITAIDQAGNETKESIQLQYQPATIITLVIGQSIATIQKNKDIKEVVMKVPPMIVKGTTFVPIRFIAETFGARVEWIPHPTNEIQIYFQDILIHLWINKTFGVVERGTETKKVTLLAAPFITNSTTMVPLRFISENLNAEVKWDAKTSTIRIIQKTE